MLERATNSMSPPRAKSTKLGTRLEGRAGQRDDAGQLLPGGRRSTRICSGEVMSNFGARDCSGDVTSNLGAAGRRTVGRAAGAGRVGAAASGRGGTGRSTTGADDATGAGGAGPSARWAARRPTRLGRGRDRRRAGGVRVRGAGRQDDQRARGGHGRDLGLGVLALGGPTLALRAVGALRTPLALGQVDQADLPGGGRRLHGAGHLARRVARRRAPVPRLQVIGVVPAVQAPVPVGADGTFTIGALRIFTRHARFFDTWAVRTKRFLADRLMFSCISSALHAFHPPIRGASGPCDPRSTRSEAHAAWTGDRRRVGPAVARRPTS